MNVKPNVFFFYSTYTNYFIFIFFLNQSPIENFDFSFKGFIVKKKIERKIFKSKKV